MSLVHRAMNPSKAAEKFTDHNSKSTLCYLESPIGWLRLRTEHEAILELSFVHASLANEKLSSECLVENPESSLECKVAESLKAYFDQRPCTFDFELNPTGTVFQRKVWGATQNVLYGQTATYGDIARAIESPGSSRAVGSALHVNPIVIFIPCHRIVGKAGLTGFGGGLDRKQYLLDLESSLFSPKELSHG